MEQGFKNQFYKNILIEIKGIVRAKWIRGYDHHGIFQQGMITTGYPYRVWSPRDIEEELNKSVDLHKMEINAWTKVWMIKHTSGLVE